MTDLFIRIKQQLLLPAEAKQAIRRDRVPVPSRPDSGIARRGWPPLRADEPPPE